MKTISIRLESIFNKLKETDLLKLKEYTDENIAEFQRILNSSIPINSNEQSIQNFIKGLSEQNCDTLYQFLIDMDVEYFILWSNIKYILQYIIYFI